MKRLLCALVLVVTGETMVSAAEPIPYATCVSTMSTCLAYVGKDTKAMLPYSINACKGPNDKWSTKTRCPSENRLGICKYSEGKPNEVWTVVYKTVYTSANEAQQHCEIAPNGKRDPEAKWLPNK